MSTIANHNDLMPTTGTNTDNQITTTTTTYSDFLRYISHILNLEERSLSSLNNYGITEPHDIASLSQDEIISTFKNDMKGVQLKQLVHVATYIRSGNVLDANTSVLDIITKLHSLPTSVTTLSTTQDNDPTPTEEAPDKSRSAPISLKAFSGKPLEFEEWYHESVNTMGTTSYHFLTQRAPTPDTPRELTRNRELFYILSTAIRKGCASYLIYEVPNDDGHALWQHLESTYNMNETSQTIITSLKDKLRSLRKTGDNSAYEYINEFSSIVATLQRRHAAPTDQELKLDFLRQIEDDAFQSYVYHCNMDPTITLQQCYTRLRQHDDHLDNSARLSSSTPKIRGIHDKNKERPTPTHGTKLKTFTPLPQALYKHISDPVNMALFRKWKYLCIAEGRGLTDTEEKEIINNPPQLKTRPYLGKKPWSPRDKQEGILKTRHNKEVQFDIAMHDQDETPSDGPPSDDDEPTPKKTKVRFIPLVRRTTSQHHPTIILDTGTEVEIIGGNGWHIHHKTDLPHKTVQGAFDNGNELQLPIVHAITAATNDEGNTILIGAGNVAHLDQATHLESFFNSNTLRQHGVIVDDVPTQFGGTQSITIDGITVPLTLSGHTLLTIKHRLPTDIELQTLPVHWLQQPDDTRFITTLTHVRKIALPQRDAIKDWPTLLAHCPAKTADTTLKHTTQYYSDSVEMENRAAPVQYRKTRLHALHPRRLPGTTYSDTFFANIPSIRKFTCAQLFFIKSCQYLHCVPLRLESQSHTALQDFLRNVGAPTTLFTDNSSTQTGKLWTTTCRTYCIAHQTCSPHNQHQNQAERLIGHLKRRILLTLQHAYAPSKFWCYCMTFVIDAINHTSSAALDDATPIERLSGNTPDISVFRYTFFQPIWYYEPTAKYPTSKWAPGYYLHIEWQAGDAFTFAIWTCPNTSWRLGRKLVRNIIKPRDASPSELDRLQQDYTSATTLTLTTPETSVFDDIYLPTPQTTQPVDQLPFETQPNTSEEPTVLNNPVALPTTTQGSLPTPPQPSTTLQDDNSQIVTPTDNNALLQQAIDPTPSSITVGDATLTSITDYRWTGSILSFKLLWSNNEYTWADFTTVREDYPHEAASYILDKPVTNPSSSRRCPKHAWATKFITQFKGTVRRLQDIHYCPTQPSTHYTKTVAALSTTKRKKKKTPKIYAQYGVDLPRNYTHAMELDKNNSNTKWADAVQKELDTLAELECFTFHPKHHRLPPEYQYTTLHLVWAVKQDLRRKARLVAGGHLVQADGLDSYSSNVKGLSVRLLQVIADHTNMHILCGDVGNAYINAYTKEKVYTVAGPEFGDKAGSIIVIDKALYGLKTSGERWHAHFANTLRSLKFTPTQYDADVWIKHNIKHNSYDYICTHVDDFMIVSHSAQAIMDQLKSVYNIKGDGPPDYYLGNDYKTHKGRLAVGCAKYISEGLAKLDSIFGKLRPYTTPLEPHDNPELDNTELLDTTQHKQFQMLIGMLNWLVTIGRYDIAFATNNLSRFSAAPRQGHLKRALRVWGYLRHHPNLRILIDSRPPIVQSHINTDYADIQQQLLERYPDAHEELDNKLPKPLIAELPITVFVDSDHAHDKITRRSVTGIVIFIGRTPADASSTRQSGIETSTYTAEFAAMKTSAEKIISIRYMLRSFGVHVTVPTLLCGDNMSVIHNVTIKDSLLKKKHIAISYHKTRECVAAGIIIPTKISGLHNYADILTKPQTHTDFKRIVSALLR